MPWDPSIIMGFKQYTGPDANQTAQTLSQLALQGVQKQHVEATLASLLEQQQRGRALQDIYRQSGGDLSKVASLAMNAGYGPESFAAQDQQAQMATRTSEAAAHAAAAQKSRAEALQKEAEAVGQVFLNVKDTPSLQAAKQALLQAGHPAEHVALIPDEYNNQTAPVIEHFKSFAMPAKDAAQLEETKRHNLEQEKKPSGIPILVTGQDGSQFLAPRPGGPAKKIVDENGNPILKPAGAGKSPDDQMDKALGEVKKDIDANLGKSGEFGKNQARLNKIDRTLAVVKQYPNPDKRQMEEIAIQLAGVLSDSGAPAQSVIHSLVPSTIGGDAASIQEWLTSEPTGVNQQKFVQRMAETLDREKGVIGGQMRDTVLPRLRSHIGTFRKYPAEFKNLVAGYGVDVNGLDNNLNAAPSSGSAPAPTAAEHPQASAAEVWAKAALAKDPSNAKAKAVLERLGAK